MGVQVEIGEVDDEAADDQDQRANHPSDDFDDARDCLPWFILI